MTAVVIVLLSLPNVPREYADLSATGLSQPLTYGPDTIADMYGAKVVLHDAGDMYTKARLEQTPLEAATWTKEESAPYPPVVRFVQAGIYAIGDRLGIGFYGVTLLLAAAFLTASAWYFLQTRWYLFPLLYLNFGFLAERFVYVQDGSYLVLLVVVVIALLLARRGSRRAAPLLVALATTMKLLPLYYVRHLRRLTPSTAWCYLAILCAGLLLPYFVWDGYLEIYRYASERKGNDWLDVTGSLALTAGVTSLLMFVERRGRFNDEDRIGWSLVPFALFAGLLANSGRHLLIALIVPDRRAGRNLAAAVGLALHAAAPNVVRLGSLVYVMTAVLVCVLLYELRTAPALPRETART